MVKKSANFKNNLNNQSAEELQQVLVNNFVSLQKVLTNLSIRFDNLSDNISKLLQLFEISAKSFIKKQEELKTLEKPEDRDLLKKLDTLLDQNKTIARGLTLMEEKIRHKVYGENTGITNKEEAGYEEENTLETDRLRKEDIADMGRIEKSRPKQMPRI